METPVWCARNGRHDFRRRLRNLQHHPVTLHYSVWAYPFSSEPTLVLWTLWCLGAIAAEAYCGMVELPIWLRTPWTITIWLLFTQVEGRSAWLWWGFTYFTLINVCVQRELNGRWSTGRLSNMMSSIGKVSYSFYLVHFPVQIIMASALRRSMGPAATPVAFILRAVVMTAASYGAARILFELVERRCLHTSEAVSTAGAS